MKKYTFLYIGGKGPEGKEEQEKDMADWTTWFNQLGSAVVDGGYPFMSGGKSVNADMSIVETSNAGGYSVIQAENLDAAVELAKNCPHLKFGGSVEVYEEMPLDMPPAAV